MPSSVAERPSSSCSSSSSASSSSLTAGREREIDPLLKGLSEKKESFRRNVVSLAAELKDVRSRLSSQEQLYARETLIRQEAENKAKKMEEDINQLQKKLEESNCQLLASSSTAREYLKELDDLRSQLSATKATADASVASAQSAQHQYLVLLKELEEKNSALMEHGTLVIKLGEQLDLLQKDLQAGEFSQKQLKDEVFRVKHDIMEALTKFDANKDCELREINKLLTAKDVDIGKLRDEIRIMSAQWKYKTKELKSQLKKNRRAVQKLKTSVLKLEFCLQEARSQTRKLQRMGEQRDIALEELRDQLATKQSLPTNMEKPNFWETPGFKIVASVSMLILVVFSKR